MTWQEAVREELTRYHQQTDADELTLQEFYDFAEHNLAEQYPHNDHVRAKIRQVLQQLRDADEVAFVDGQGSYKISDTDSMATSSDRSVDDELDLIIMMDEVGGDSPDS